MKNSSDKHFTTAIITIILFIAVLSGALYLNSAQKGNAAGDLSFLNGSQADVDSYEDITKSIDIQWKSGNVLIICSQNTDGIYMTQTDVKTGKKSKVDYSVSDDTVYITSSTEGRLLEVNIPAQSLCESLSIYCENGNITLSNANIKNISLQGANGSLYINSTSADRLEAIIKNGNIIFDNASASVIVCITNKGNITGFISANQYQIESKTGNVEIAAGENVERMDISVATGNIDVSLTKGCGYDIAMNTTLGTINVNTEAVFNGSSYIEGDGSAYVGLSTELGNVTVNYR